ncbi:transcriptional regulator [Erwinia sorbitola]|uniref:Transcriptional regulator n=1 Tax=Erwinia sorbitola TaxID=2681984 RepID=A0A6I6E910_9GAMM|nr:transcriptional regulator [Erwinia sorbitola]QGU86274.1 transcriptional regulator [Erwinia sorbitola]
MTADFIIHHWYVDFSSGALLHQSSGEQRRLGEYQLKLLLVLAENAGKILTRDELNTLVWEDRVVGNNSLPNAIHALRVALEDDGKQQRIIKTIPRKGYILEAEYCQRVSATEKETLAEIAPLSHEPPQLYDEHAERSLTESAAEPLSASLAEPAVESSAPVKKQRFWYWLVPAQVLLLIGLIVWFFVLPAYAPPSRVNELDSASYSNIRLMELERRPIRTNASEELNKQLVSMLPQLNQMLKDQKVTMEVFFFATSMSLNYTLTLTSPCNSEQLAMNILNWRTNGPLLTALIYRETERKLNEMENCVR